jgi:hypothetical protein
VHSPRFLNDTLRAACEDASLAPFERKLTWLGDVTFRADDIPWWGWWVCGVGFRAQGSGFRAQGSGFRGQGSGFRGQGSRFRGQGSGFKVYRLGI